MDLVTVRRRLTNDPLQLAHDVEFQTQPVAECSMKKLYFSIVKV